MVIRTSLRRRPFLFIQSNRPHIVSDGQLVKILGSCTVSSDEKASYFHYWSFDADARRVRGIIAGAWDNGDSRCAVTIPLTPQSSIQ